MKRVDVKKGEGFEGRDDIFNGLQLDLKIEGIWGHSFTLDFTECQPKFKIDFNNQQWRTSLYKQVKFTQKVKLFGLLNECMVF